MDSNIIIYKGYTIRKIKDNISIRYELVIDDKMVMWDYNIKYVKLYIEWTYKNNII